MIIAHVISGLAKASGPTTFCNEVADHLAALGSTVELYVEELEDDAALPQSSSIKVVEFGGRFSPSITPHVIHAHALWIPSSHRAVCYAYKKGIPCVFSTHGMLAPWAMNHKWLKKRVAWFLYQKEDLKRVSMFQVTAPSEIDWIRNLGFKQPCALVPLGAHIPKVFREERSLHRNIKTILFVGRIYPVKGLMNLVAAWGIINKKKREIWNQCCAGASWQLIIAGPDQAGHKAELEKKAKELGLRLGDVSVRKWLSETVAQEIQYDIIFTGPVYGQEKELLYRMADLFVLPSYTENFGAVVTDALAHGIPVITTSGTPWEELNNCESTLNQKQTSDNVVMCPCRAGWWVDIGVEPLIGALIEAMSLTDEERRNIGLNGRKLVETKYSWPSVAKKMLAAYEWIAQGGDRPECIIME